MITHQSHECGCVTLTGDGIKKYLIFCVLAAEHFDASDSLWLQTQHAL